MDSTTRNIAALLAAIGVLVVDDDLASRKAVRALLSAIGVNTVYEATNAAEGLETVRLRNPRVVLLDWAMPGMDGAAFMRNLGSRYPAPPVIMLVGQSELARVMEAIDLGVHEFLVKPVSAPALRMRIASVLSDARPMRQRDHDYGPRPRHRSAHRAARENTAGVGDAAADPLRRAAVLID
ncbi:MAG: response regulator [Hyphomicrobiales bacterium]|nr:response regulator [Hyphomicrobiales bacterium]